MMWPLKSSEKAIDDSSRERAEVAIRGAPLEDHQKSRWERSWPPGLQSHVALVSSLTVT